jgi:hypothetical protein
MQQKEEQHLVHILFPGFMSIPNSVVGQSTWYGRAVSTTAELAPPIQASLLSIDSEDCDFAFRCC